MVDRPTVEALLARHGYSDYRWIQPSAIVVAQWVRIKCMFGCGEYGHNASCPPNVPTVAECRQFLDEYEEGLVLHFAHAVEQPEDRHAWSRGVNEGLVSLERAVFLAGYRKAFLLFMDSCGLCPKCAGRRTACNEPRTARPTPEALGVDVFTTVQRLGYPIQVLTEYTQEMNRYAFLLVE